MNMTKEHKAELRELKQALRESERQIARIRRNVATNTLAAERAKRREARTIDRSLLRYVRSAAAEAKGAARRGEAARKRIAILEGRLA